MISPELRDQLIQAADEARQHAYVPYSRYRVGAALLTQDGQTIRGCNVENAAYPMSICAERTALVKAISEGIRDFQAIVVVTDNGGSPCGACRQMLYEFAPDLQVIIADGAGKVHLDLSLRDLLAYGFGPEKLS